MIMTFLKIFILARYSHSTIHPISSNIQIEPRNQQKMLKKTLAYLQKYPYLCLKLTIKFTKNIASHHREIEKEQLKPEQG